MKSDLKDCSCLISQMRQVRGDVVKGQKAVEELLGIFLLPLYKTQGNIQQNVEKGVFQVNGQKYALNIWAPSPSSAFQELRLSLELAEKIQYRLSEDVCWLVSLLGASFGQGCEPIGLIQTEL